MAICVLKRFTDARLVCKTRIDKLNDELFSKSSEIAAGGCIYAVGV
ncbi:hypothetical protein [Chamaesiphon sp. OTE_20_metabat_361]|nr:hypothetical protein [Chamaesiphon sp. OTE_20_metabat_361]